MRERRLHRAMMEIHRYRVETLAQVRTAQANMRVRRDLARGEISYTDAAIHRVNSAWAVGGIGDEEHEAALAWVLAGGDWPLPSGVFPPSVSVASR
jgi:hypothetical protein